jgi:hypothetical protein
MRQEIAGYVVVSPGTVVGGPLASKLAARRCAAVLDWAVAPLYTPVGTQAGAGDAVAAVVIVDGDHTRIFGPFENETKAETWARSYRGVGETCVGFMMMPAAKLIGEAPAARLASGSGGQVHPNRGGPYHGR